MKFRKILVILWLFKYLVKAYNATSMGGVDE
jgi:hypothetical protein